VKLRILTSPDVTVAACILISTSLSLGVGFSTSLSSRTSGGPYFVHTIAFISLPPDLLGFVILTYSYNCISLAVKN